MRVIILLVVFMFLSGNASADFTRVFKRLSDEKVKTVHVTGPGPIPVDNQESFVSLFGSLEDFETADVENIPENAKKIDIVNGQAVFTKFSQQEIDARPENVNKRKHEQNKIKARNEFKQLGISDDALSAIGL